MNDIFVGIACYNRPDGLRATIRCMREQTHQEWTALICDNASPDPRVQQIAQQAVASDSRFQYHRHSENIGATANFRYSVARCNRPCFMWASDDDLWHPDFMKKNLECLHRSTDAQLAFCSVEVINIDGKMRFPLHGFSRFTSRGERKTDLIRYLKDPENRGKANLFYSLFRTEALQSCIDECWDDAHSNAYAADNVFLFSFLCRNSMIAHDEVHLFKRQPTTKTRRIDWRHPRSYRVTEPHELESYIQRHRTVAPTLEFADLAETIIRRRQSQRLVYRIPGINRLLPD